MQHHYGDPIATSRVYAMPTWDYLTVSEDSSHDDRKITPIHRAETPSHREMLTLSEIDAQSRLMSLATSNDAWRLERLADDFLRNHGETVTRLDLAEAVMSPVTMLDYLSSPRMRPDKVAWRGAARVKVRHHEYRTDDAGRLVTRRVGKVTRVDGRLVVVSQPGHWVGCGPFVADDTCQVKAVKARSARATATAPRGRAVSWWTAGESTIHRHAAARREDEAFTHQVDELVAVLTTSAPAHMVPISETEQVTTGDDCATVVRATGVRYSYRSYARRAVLAGVTID